MSSTFLQLQDQVLLHRFSDTKYRDSVKTYLNEAQRHICLQANLRTQLTTATVTTVNGTAGYSMPTDFMRFEELFIPAYDRILAEMDLRTYDDLTATTAMPNSYLIIGNTLTLYPTPDAVYSITHRYWKMPTDMSANSDTPAIPVQYEHLLVDYALHRCYQRENDAQMAQMHRNAYDTALQIAKGEINSDTYDRPVQVPGAWDETPVDPNAWH